MIQTTIKTPRLEDVCATSTSGATIVITDTNKLVNDLRSRDVVEDYECILNVFEEFSFENILEVLEFLKVEEE